jgi:DNA-binding PadR family transcriptional regulator
MAEWLDTDKSAVSKLINKLSKAGYINKLEYYSGGVKCFEYTANYEAMLVKAMLGEEMGLEGPSIKGGCQNDNGCQNDQKGLSKRPKSVVKMTTNNKDIIIYNNFYCAEPAQQEEEKKNFYKLFFWKNAADPAAEVEKFIDYNNSLQWRNDKGRVYETPEQRLSLAGLWQFKTEGQWARADYLKALKSIVNDSPSDSGVEVLINHKVNLVWDGRQSKWFWKVTAEARKWIEANRDIVHKFLDPVTRGKTVTWGTAS